MRYLLDTNIISEPTKQQPSSAVIQQLELKTIFSCTSATVWTELWYGVHLLEQGKRKQELTDYLNTLSEKGFSILPFCQDAAEWLANEKARLKQRGIISSKYDSEIAAVAVVNNLTLVTRNTDDFAMFDELRLENWFEKMIRV